MAGWNGAAVGIMNAMTNQGTLLMKMKILSMGKNYDVMDKDQRVLATIGLDANQNMTAGAIGGDYVGRFARRSLSYTYDVKDPAGNLALQIKKGSGGNTA